MVLPNFKTCRSETFHQGHWTSYNDSKPDKFQTLKINDNTSYEQLYGRLSYVRRARVSEFISKRMKNQTQSTSKYALFSPWETIKKLALFNYFKMYFNCM